MMMMTTAILLVLATALFLLPYHSTPGVLAGTGEVHCEKGEREFKGFHAWAKCAKAAVSVWSGHLEDDIIKTEKCVEVNNKTQGLCFFKLLVTNKKSGTLTGTLSCLTVADMDKYDHTPAKQGGTNVIGEEKDDIGIIVSFPKETSSRSQEVVPDAVQQLKKTLEGKNIPLGDDKCGGHKSGAGTVQLNVVATILVFAGAVTAFAASF